MLWCNNVGQHFQTKISVSTKILGNLTNKGLVFFLYQRRALFFTALSFIDDQVRHIFFRRIICKYKQVNYFLSPNNSVVFESLSSDCCLPYKLHTSLKLPQRRLYMLSENEWIKLKLQKRWGQKQDFCSGNYTIATH